MKNISFTKPYIYLPLVIDKKSGETFIDDLKNKGKKFLEVENYAFIDDLKESLII